MKILSILKFGMTREWLYRKLAYLLPRKLVYYAAVRLWAYASTGEYSYVNIDFKRALDAWDRKVAYAMEPDDKWE